jgi:hypothetical protein
VLALGYGSRAYVSSAIFPIPSLVVVPVRVASQSIKNTGMQNEKTAVGLGSIKEKHGCSDKIQNNNKNHEQQKERELLISIDRKNSSPHDNQE